MKIVVKQGKRGRWRWLLYDGDKFQAISGIRGWPTKKEAEDAAMKALGSPTEIETEFGVLYGGDRDWQ